MERTRDLSFTGYTLDGLSKEQIVELCESSGSVGFECAPPQLEGLNLDETKEFGQWFRDAGVRIDTLHLPFGRKFDIAAFYEFDRVSAVKTIGGWLEQAAAVGARAVIQHPASASAGTDDEGTTPFLDKLCRSLEALLPHAERLGLTIAVENMLPGSNRQFGSEPEHLVAVNEKMAHPALGFCLDTGHATVARETKAVDVFFDALGDKLMCFHLSDTAGDRDMHLAPGKGNVDWKTVFSRVASLGEGLAMTIEVPPFAWGPPYASEAWSALVSDTKAIIEAS